MEDLRNKKKDEITLGKMEYNPKNYCPIVHEKLRDHELHNIPAYVQGNFPSEIGGYVFYGYCEHFIQVLVDTADKGQKIKLSYTRPK